MRFLQSKIQAILLVSIVLVIPFFQVFSNDLILPDYSINQCNPVTIHSRAPLNYVKVKGYSRRNKSPNPLLDDIVHLSQANIKPNQKASGMSIVLQIPFP